MKTPLWTLDDLTDALIKGTEGCSEKALVMYSHERGAMMTDPRGMFLPVEDHLVHRGDGVFETLLYAGRGMYNVDAHLNRLHTSAKALGIEWPVPRENLIQILKDCFEAGKEKPALARVLLGRGTGGFSVDPAEASQASLYIIVYKALPPFSVRTPEGARAVISRVPPKSGGLASIKSCNYIPNALMKAEANAAGVHFALGVDAEGFVTESATENIAAIDRDGRLVIPPAEAHLPGTTLQRVAELAASDGRKVIHRPFRPSELFDMAEGLLVGTTTYVAPLVELDGREVPQGPVAGELNAMLTRDIGEAALPDQ